MTGLRSLALKLSPSSLPALLPAQRPCNTRCLRCKVNFGSNQRDDPECHHSPRDFMLTSSPRNVVTTSTRFLSLSLLVEIQRRATSTHHREPRRPSFHDVPLALSMGGGGPRTRRIRRTQTLHGLAPFPQSHIFPALRHVGKPPTLFPPRGRPHSHTDARLRECLQLSVLW